MAHGGGALVHPKIFPGHGRASGSLAGERASVMRRAAAGGDSGDRVDVRPNGYARAGASEHEHAPHRRRRERALDPSGSAGAGSRSRAPAYLMYYYPLSSLRAATISTAPSVRAGRVYWPNRPRADAWGYVSATEYGQ